MGKGLDSLITDKVSKPVKPKSRACCGCSNDRYKKVEPNREQPRKNLMKMHSIELSESIKQFGVLQPFFVRNVTIITK